MGTFGKRRNFAGVVPQSGERRSPRRDARPYAAKPIVAQPQRTIESVDALPADGQ